jgi:glycosyltransferase involved in cell wall biosynthesis
LILGINAFFKAKWISPVSSHHLIQQSTLLPGHHFVPFVSATNVIRKTSLSAPIRLLSIGKFEPRKNHILLLKTLPALDAAGFSISLTLIGECSTEKHQSEYERVSLFIRENELSDRVTLLTNQPAQAMSRFYLDADLFILPSSAEPASVSVIEALGFGLPVICSSQNGTKCYIEPEMNGDVFEDGNLDSLMHKMITQLTRMTTNPEWMFEQCQLASEAKVAPDEFLNALSGAVA